MSNDNKDSRRNKIISISIIIVIIGGGGFILGWLSNNSFYFSSNPKQITPELDGEYNEREWLRASYYNIPFYLDVNNTIDPIVDKANVDGWNYLSVAEDDDYYYVGLDLCSDRTNNMEGEWISLGLGNRIADTTDSELAFFALENYGFEYMIYNVSAEQVVDYELIYAPEGHTFHSIPFVPEYNQYEVIRGGIEGDITDLWAEDEPDGVHDTEKVLTLNSDYYDETSLYPAGDCAIMDFAINVTEMLPTYNSTDFTMMSLAMDLILTGNVSANTSFSEYNTTADTIWLSILEHGPMEIEYDDPLYMSVFNNQSFSNNGYFSWKTINFDHTQINGSNGMYHFSLAAWNPVNLTASTAFELYLNKMSFKIRTNWIRTTRGTTINMDNYNLAYSYGSSSNCAEEHRMFEFQISKSEFPTTLDDMFYLNVAGYGTMAMDGTDYWMYPREDLQGFQSSVMWNYYNSYNDFLAFDMSIT